jgi:hypothetical protein
LEPLALRFYCELKAFYSGNTDKVAYIEREKDYKLALTDLQLLHQNSFRQCYTLIRILLYFRPEIQVSSNEGLNAYGAVTWGQFFIYQGFNENCGWMHTS